MEEKNVKEGDGCCSLCLELKQEFVDAIFINSVQCNSLNIKHLIEKYLWTMKHIGPNSWICVNCWTVLFHFHNFCMRIKKTHGRLELFSNKMDGSPVDEIESELMGFKESPINILLNCPINITKDENSTINGYNNEVESHVIDFKETPNELFMDCPVSEINDDATSNEHNPLLDVATSPLLERKSRLRKAKVNKTDQHGICKIKSCRATTHLRDSTNKKNGNKKISNKKINSIENASDVENFGTKQEHLVSNESEKEQFTQADIKDSIKETDLKSLTSVQENSNVKPNTRTRVLCNEKDKFLAENFKITCFLCDIPFETFCNVLNHFKQQHKEPGYIQCCDKKFYRRNVLIDHVNYHLDPTYFKCNQCDKVLEDRRRLELHCKSHEINNGKHFCCNTCGKGFIKLAMLNAHKKIHLSEEDKRFRCHECGKNFATNCMLTNHCRQTHLKKYHKICEICGKSIQDKTIFERHMLQHDGKTAPSASCDVCGLLLTDEKALERHKKVIHPENGLKLYTCSICNKISPNLRNHKLHVRFTHESGYNYKCTICDKAFKRAQPLKEHMASHTGEILYSCPWCPKTFNSNANMHNHRKKVHPKEWEETSRKRYSGKLPPRFKPPTTIEQPVTATP